jgi:hypothetical protein
MSLHHKLCHTLGGTLDLPHAQTHTVVLPHALGFNQPAAPQAVAALSRALGGVADPARELWNSPGGWVLRGRWPSWAWPTRTSRASPSPVPTPIRGR